MKKKFLSYLTLLAVAVGFSACNDDTWNPGIDNVDGEGQLNTGKLVPEVVNAEKIISDQKGPRKVASRASIDLSDYIVTVTNNATGEVAAEWKYSQMPSLPTFSVGTYTLTVESHKVQPVEWDKAYFNGSEIFQIKNGEITDIETVVCKLANIKVGITFGEKLVAAGSDIKVTVTSADNHQAEFTPEETRKAYFEAIDGLKTLEVHFTGVINGSQEDFVYVLSDVEAGQFRNISFGLKSNTNPIPDEFGQITDEGDGINVSTNVVEEDLTTNTPWDEETGDSSDRPNHEGEKPVDPENPDNPDTPTPPVPGNSITFDSDPDGFEFDFDGINDAADIVGHPARIIIKAPEGIKNLNVNIKSNSLNEEVLNEVGLAPSFDLADPKELKEGLEGLGFKTGADVIGKTEVVFDITDFMTLLQIYSDTHEFLLEVTDMKNNSDTLSLKIKS